jgi:hypothetical protein
VTKIQKILAINILCLIILSATTVALAYAQAETTTPIIDEPTKTTISVAIGWLLYTLLGLLASVINGSTFDPKKFTTTILWAIIVAILAIVLKIHPTQVISDYPNLISEILTYVGSSGMGLSLIFFVDKLYQIAIGYKNSLKKLATPKTPTG